MFEAKNIMSDVVFSVSPDTPAVEAARIIVNNAVSGLPVVDDDLNLVGIVSEQDLLKFMNDPNSEVLTVSNLMTKDVISFEEDASVIDICHCLINNNFRRVPITKEGMLVGIVSRRDVLRRILEMKNISVNDNNEKDD